MSTSTSTPSTPSKEAKPSRWGRVVRRSTTLLTGGSSRDSSRPGTPGSELANPADSSPTPPSSGSTPNLNNPNTNNTKGEGDNDDTASIKSSKSTKGSLTSRILGRSGSSASLRGSLKRKKTLDTSEGGLAPPANPSVAGLMVPSPIAESPNREALETPQAFGLGASPLANEVSTTTTDDGARNANASEGSGIMEPVTDVDADSASASPTGYVAPPLLDSSAGNPGAFTDESDTLPQPTVIANPYAATGTGSRVGSQVNLLPNLQDNERRGTEGSLPNPHDGRRRDTEEKREDSALPNPHDATPAPRVLEGGASVGPSLVSTEQDYGEETGERGAFFGRPLVESLGSRSVSASANDSKSQFSPEVSRGVSRQVSRGEALREEGREEGGFKAAVEENAALPPKDGGSGYPREKKNGDATQQEDGHEREQTLPAYEQNNGQNAWARESPLVGVSNDEVRDPFVQAHETYASAHASQSAAGVGRGNLVYETQQRAGGVPKRGEDLIAKTEEPESYLGEQPVWGAVPPRIEVSRSGAGDGSVPGMPQPQPATTQVMPIETHRDDHPTIFMPLPPFNSVVAAQPLAQPSASTRSRDQYETDETRPLLGNRSSTAKLPTATYGVRPTESTDAGNPSPLSAWVPSASYSNDGRNSTYRLRQPQGQGVGVGEGRQGPKLHELGWFEYHLPDGSFYYVHPTLKVTTDVNLRNEKVLEDVTLWLDANPPFGEVGGHPGYGATNDSFVGTGNGKASKGSGVEVWLRDLNDAGAPKRRVRPRRGEREGGRYARCWVDHAARTVVVEKLGDDNKGKGRLVKGRKVEEEEDQLDMEYRYWSFMEAHPAHAVLPIKSKNEALEVLTWARTDHLLPSQKPAPAPFSPDECQELMTLLKSFPADAPDDNGIQTRVVARVLLRVAIWRQKYFRSHKALPKDVKTPPSNKVAGPGRSAIRAVADLFVVIVCLGLPFIFVERRRERVGYEEAWGGVPRERSAAPVFVVGMISCLVAAVILSASVTFISLPGMDGVARIAGFVAISCAVGSMLASMVAFIRFRNDLAGVVERPAVHGSAEGLFGISKHAVVTSLPLVFLAYSIIGFVVGLSIYSFRGPSIDDPNADGMGVSVWALGEGARWTVLGLLGAAGGVVAMSWVVWKQ